MQTKLTLRLDKELIERAKIYARQTERSLSQLVADYFALIGREDGDTQPAALPTLVANLKGCLKGAKLNEEDYRRYLEEKYS